VARITRGRTGVFDALHAPLELDDALAERPHHLGQPSAKKEQHHRCHDQQFQWVGPGRKRKATAPGENGVVDLSPFEFLDRLADLVPPPRRHRHRYHGVFAPNHPLRPAVTALAIGIFGRRGDAAASPPLPLGEGRRVADPDAQPRSHDTSRIGWAKLLAKIAEDFPLACPACGGDIRLIACIIEPAPIRSL
jgi:hypothetical protein